MPMEGDGDFSREALDRFRKEIDVIDGQILSLLGRRLDAAAAIGRIKCKMGLAVFDAAREKEILDRMAANHSERLSADAVRDIYSRIISASRSVQVPLNEGCTPHGPALTDRTAGAPIRRNDKAMVCIAIMAHNTDEALQKMAAAHAVCDLMELRLDVMESFDLKKLISSASKPVLITYRSKKEGGSGNAPYHVRVNFLMEAMKLGADYVDVEYTIPLEHRRLLFKNRGPGRLVLSKHFRNGTPSRETLSNLMRKMVATGARVVKIVTFAKSFEDNLIVMELISQAEKMGVEVVAFCMGPIGRLSRVACPILGGAFTFASLEKGQESASGQITAKEMKRILGALSS
jgi:3-dehydroquinate dehydratase-1